MKYRPTRRHYPFRKKNPDTIHSPSSASKSSNEKNPTHHFFLGPVALHAHMHLDISSLSIHGSRGSLLTHQQMFTQLEILDYKKNPSLPTFSITKPTSAIAIFSSLSFSLCLCNISRINKSSSSFLPLISILVVLLAITGQAVAGRSVPTNDDKKQPEWFVGHDGSFLIPGIGSMMFLTLHNVVPQTPFLDNGGTGSTGGSGETPSTGHDYVPGGDDTLVPNPGYEVPTSNPWQWCRDYPSDLHQSLNLFEHEGFA